MSRIRILRFIRFIDVVSGGAEELGGEDEGAGGG